MTGQVSWASLSLKCLRSPGRVGVKGREDWRLGGGVIGKISEGAPFSVNRITEVGVVYRSNSLESKNLGNFEMRVLARLVVLAASGCGWGLGDECETVI